MHCRLFLDETRFKNLANLRRILVDASCFHLAEGWVRWERPESILYKSTLLYLILYFDKIFRTVIPESATEKEGRPEWSRSKNYFCIMVCESKTL